MNKTRTYKAKMKKRIIILVSSDEVLSKSSRDYDIRLSELDFINIMRVCREANLYKLISNQISFSCQNCNSYVIPIQHLHKLIGEITDFLFEDDFCQKHDIYYEDIYENMSEIENCLIEKIIMSKDEWKAYYESGKDNLDFITNEKGEEITDEEGNPMKYLAEEVGFIMDPDCECKKVIAGTN